MNLTRVLLAVIALAAMVLIGVSIARLPSDSSLWGIVQAGLFLGFCVLIYLGLTSVYIIPTDKMMASIFLGTWRTTYLSGTAADRKDVRGTKFIDYVDDNGNRVAHQGLFGSDIVILLYPLWTVRLFPLTENVGIVHVSRVYTKHVPPESPEVPALVDVTITWELSPYLKPLIQTFPVIGDGPYDLGRKCKLHDNQWDRDDEKNHKHEYDSTPLAGLVMNVIGNDIVHKVRTVGANYQWIGGGTKNIKSEKHSYEKELLAALFEPDAAIVRGGLLGEITDPADPSKKRIGAGKAASSFDVIIEDVAVEDPEVSKALGKPLIAAMEAQAETTRGEGKGRYYAKIEAESGIKARDAAMLETLDKSQGDLNVWTAGPGGLLQHLNRILGGKKPPKVKTPPEKKGS